MKAINCQEFLTKENNWAHLVRRLVRRYHLKGLAKKMRVETRMPPYPPYYGF